MLVGPSVRGEVWLQTYSGGEGLGRSHFCKIEGLTPGRHTLYLQKKVGQPMRALFSVEANEAGVADHPTSLFGHGSAEPGWEGPDYAPGLRLVVGNGEASGEAIKLKK